MEQKEEAAIIAIQLNYESGVLTKEDAERELRLLGTGFLRILAIIGDSDLKMRRRQAASQ